MVVKECTFAEIKQLAAEYLEGLSSPFDSFLEDHILTSVFYRIQDGPEDAGYYAIHKQELLTQFYIRKPYLKHAQPLFLEALERHAVKNLFVPTCDELFLSLAIDQDFKINKQAYFFQDSQSAMVASPSEGEVFRLAREDELQAIQRVCGDFLSDYKHWIAAERLFVFYRAADLLGIGIMETSRMFDGHASIGMFTNEAFRKQGNGKALIVHLRRWCKEHGITAICGCWYYNEASKRTLESAGMVTKTRLLNIEVSTASKSKSTEQKDNS
ncbi:GNAT family N-acetyltransferase [Paenibacillus glycanilyticus]|uniref:GNAT family N-acetyltransferase n=1 Tax=Paenibacillus glycanilyticus TaxID=126569 RepID=UPI0020402686|nr:GNAT family N-acetyltransferase [Paenibacillus glycanilyticus]MCM3627766.1 GNAT family N-acetyltransferase [Paenibacillus glycanilyticus]